MTEKRSLKIGLVCPYDITKGGGVQEIVLAMQAKLTDRGHEVKIITPMPSDSEVIDVPGVIFVGTAKDFKSPTHTTIQVSRTSEGDKISEMLEIEKFDILHFHEPWVPVLGRQILSRSKAVNIATFHAVVPETLMSRTVAKVVTPYAQSVLKYINEYTAVSETAALYIKSLTDAPIQIIPNAIDLENFKYKPKKKSAQLTILYLGRLERRKGVNYLLKALKELNQEMDDVQLLIAGDGPDREKLEQQTKSLELKNVQFLGYVSDEKRLELLQQADVYCSPALYGESFGIVLLEAMAVGTVVVAGNNSGYIGLMQGAGALSIVNPKESDEFARRLKLMLSEESVRKLWQDWAKDYIQQFDYENIIDHYENLYFKAIHKQERTI